MENDILRRPPAQKASRGKEASTNTSQPPKLVPLEDRSKKNSRKHASAQKAPQVTTVEEDAEEDQPMEDMIEATAADTSKRSV